MGADEDVEDPWDPPPHPADFEELLACVGKAHKDALHQTNQEKQALLAEVFRLRKAVCPRSAAKAEAGEDAASDQWHVQYPPTFDLDDALDLSSRWRDPPRFLVEPVHRMQASSTHSPTGAMSAQKENQKDVPQSSLTLKEADVSIMECLEAPGSVPGSKRMDTGGADGGVVRLAPDGRRRDNKLRLELPAGAPPSGPSGGYSLVSDSQADDQATEGHESSNFASEQPDPHSRRTRSSATQKTEKSQASSSRVSPETPKPALQRLGSRRNTHSSLSLLAPSSVPEEGTNMDKQKGDAAKMVNASELILRLMRQTTTHTDKFLSENNMQGSSGGSQWSRKLHKAIRRVISSAPFDLFCAAVILLNAITVGMEVHWVAQDDDVPSFMWVIEATIVSWYFLELLLRLSVDHFRHNLGWNLFDFVLFLGSLANVVASVDEMPQSVSIVRFLRFVRVLRAVKMIKLGRTANSYFIVFSKMTYCLMQSLPSLLSSACVLGVFTYLCAILLTQSATAFRDQHEPHEHIHSGIEEHYGSLDKTFYSLFKAISSGQSWGELLQPCAEIGMFTSIVFGLYLVITLLCIMNVIQGVFVDSALQSTAHYKELMVAELQRKRQFLLHHLQGVFKDIDEDNSGYISCEEFEIFLGTEGGRTFFEVMGLSTIQATELFRLLDSDGSYTVDITEFSDGCMKVMGEAKNFDIQCIMAENRQMLARWAAFVDNFEPTMRRCFQVALEAHFLGASAQQGGAPSRANSRKQLASQTPVGSNTTSFVKDLMEQFEKDIMSPVVSGGTLQAGRTRSAGQNHLTRKASASSYSNVGAPLSSYVSMEIGSVGTDSVGPHATATEDVTIDCGEDSHQLQGEIPSIRVAAPLSRMELGSKGTGPPDQPRVLHNL